MRHQHRQRDFGLAFATNGVRPRFFFHADCIPGANGDEATTQGFPCFGIPPNPDASQPDPPLISAAGGLSGRRMLAFGAGGHLRIDALAATYTSMADALVMVANIKIPNTAAQRTILDFGLNGATNRFADHYVDGTSDQIGLYYQNNAGTVVSGGTAGAVTMGAWINLAIATNGFQLSVFELTSGGENRLATAAALVKSGAVTFDRGCIGAEWNNTSAGNFGQFDCRAFGIYHMPNYSSTQLSNLLVHMRDKLDCAVG